MYTYKDFMTGKIKRTRGKFDGWTEPCGLLNVPMARFTLPSGSCWFIPEWCLTPETRKAITPCPNHNETGEN
jgi:hypothetical protein